MKANDTGFDAVGNMLASLAELCETAGEAQIAALLHIVDVARQRGETAELAGCVLKYAKRSERRAGERLRTIAVSN